MQIIQLDTQHPDYPKQLLKIKDYPKTLYAIGNTTLLNKKNILAIVGSRACTAYGRNVATSFASELSKKDICIISGLAIGIDGASHYGALEHKGKTIAVLGCGLNHIYPKENEWLFHKILLNGGCAISEYPPDVEANMSNFPKRNRIISGISSGVLVVEAHYRSGSAITAKYAKEQGKNVYAIPSNIDSTNGVRNKSFNSTRSKANYKTITNSKRLYSRQFKKSKY